MTAVRSVIGDDLPGEAERAAHRALVEVERSGLAAPGEEQFVAPVVVAVERRHAAADEEVRLPRVPVVDACCRCLVDEMRRLVGGRLACRLTGAQPWQHDCEHSADHHHRQHRDDQPSGA